MRTALTAEAIFAAFPVDPAMKTMQGEPNVSNILALRKDLERNARNTRCPYSINGYLFAVLGKPTYDLRHPAEAASCFVPQHPGPLIAGSALTFPERSAAHDSALARWEEYRAMAQALLKHITIVVGDDIISTYTDAAERIPEPDELMGYLIRDYVTNTYSAQDVEAARMRMIAKIDLATTKWAHFVAQIEHGRGILEIYGQPLSTSELANKALATLEHIGAPLRREIIKFRKRPANEQTWDRIKGHFLPLYLAAASTQTAKSETDFNSAVNSVLGVPAAEPGQQRAAQQAAANVVDGLAESLKTMMAQNQQMMTAFLAQSGGGGGGGGGGSGGGGGGGGRNAMTPGRHGYYYCWTHGKCHHGHGHPTEGWQTCRHPAAGHIATATAANKQGGNCSGWDGSTGL